MNFARALERNPVPPRLGDVWLRYDRTLLIGEAGRARGVLRYLPEAATLLGAGLALGALAGVVAGRARASALLAALASGGALVIAAILARRGRPRRFVLNFATESLRLERAGQTRVVPFAAVKAIFVERGEAGYALIVELEEPAPSGAPPASRTEPLIEAVREEELVGLGRTWRALAAALGVPTGGGSPPEDS
jgi:hypothetical protein